MAISSDTNLYEILEISSTASSFTIKSAYRKLARKYHPDLNGGDEYYVKKFKQITEAYEILSDEDKKKNYDILKGFYQSEDSGARRKQANKAYKDVEHATKSSDRAYETADNFANEAFSRVFSDIMSGFKSTTSKSQKKTKTSQAAPERGTDVYSDVTISLAESFSGTTRVINILHTEKCSNCEGRKFINNSKCSFCNGAGENSSYKRLSVKIPPNVKHGSKIRIANEGNKGYNGGKNGDLYLNIKIENSSIFSYEGLNILCTVPITPFEAVLGDSINIPTASGVINMKVSPKTHSGQKFRLSGQGLADKTGKRGDMIVTIKIEIPKILTEEEIDLYKKLKDVAKDDIRRNLFNGI